MDRARDDDATTGVQAAEIVREYGPFSDSPNVHGVTFDGTQVWFAAGDALRAIDPSSGRAVRAIDVAADAGTAFDGRYFYQLADERIQKIDPASGAVVATLPAPGKGNDSGLTWAEGTLWVGQYRDRKIHQIDAETGAILRTIESNRFVTGVTWVDGELWHGTWEDDRSEIRHIDPESGKVLTRLTMPEGVGVSGLESDGADVFYAGGGPSGKVRAVRRPSACVDDTGFVHASTPRLRATLSANGHSWSAVRVSLSLCWALRLQWTGSIEQNHDGSGSI